ncbi:MAG TPA: dolichyl-phosphate beta-glucosyltransferase [Dehalococcoidia bacterium]|nr:dolichyl-phosphate beta-glucosyltransferase [Dehalococcoidia bacterium]
MATVDVVLPVYNEESVIAQSVATLLEWFDGHPEHEWRVVVANNASTDRTLAIARTLSEQHPGRVAALDVPAKGKGLALRIAWLTSPADVNAYMDVDLSTDIEHLPELVDPIAAGDVDVTYGTRLDPRSQTTRQLFREVVGRGYVFVFQTLLGLRVTDAQCGFKAMSRDATREILPLVLHTHWFWDTEMLMVAQENRYRMRAVPVKWIEDTDSSVAVVDTALDDLRGIWRLRTGGVPRVSRGAARWPERDGDGEPPGDRAIP